VIRDVMAIAQRHEVPHLVRSALCLRNDVMDLETPRRATSGHGTRTAERHHDLLAHPRSHRARRAFGARRGEIAHDSRIAPRAIVGDGSGPLVPTRQRVEARVDLVRVASLPIAPEELHEHR